jgi:sulfate permease
LFLWLSVAIGFFFAANIGASGAAAAFGAAYGSGAVTQRIALLLCAAFVFAGSALAGERAATTIGKGLLQTQELPAACAVIILAAACLSLFTANLLGIPLSTSQVTVGAVVGAALVLGGPPPGKVAMIVATWVAIPVLSFFAAYLFQRYLIHWLRLLLRGRRPFVAFLLALGGCYEAFAAGSKNVANAIGPLIGGGLVPLALGLVGGGLALALGALTLGGRVMGTHGKKITALDMLSGSIVSFTGATLVVAASLLGIPTSLNHATTMGVIGVGYANGGARSLNPIILRRLAAVWLVSPFLSLALSYLGTTVLLHRAPPLLTSLGVGAGTVLALMLGGRLLRGETSRTVLLPQEIPVAEVRAQK